MKLYTLYLPLLLIEHSPTTDDEYYFVLSLNDDAIDALIVAVTLLLTT